MRTIHTLLLAALIGCSGSTTAEDTAGGDTRVVGTTQTISVFDKEWVHFGAENKRTVDIPVSLPPASETYSNINGRFRLECPTVTGGCDHWDRYGTFGIVLNAGEEDETLVEIDRFITPYRTGFGWEADLTAYRPLLTGDVTLRVFIDTWVSEGHSDGAGWLFTADLDFEGGAPLSPEPDIIVPVWGHLSYNSGDPAAVTERFAGETVELPERVSWQLRSFITGHGFGGNDNCAEFCALDHTYTVDGFDLTRNVWRSDCESTVTDSTQQGTWTYDRAGWCPGAQVFPWVQQVATTGGGPIEVSYDLENWTWQGNGGQPYYYMSAVLVGYR